MRTATIITLAIALLFSLPACKKKKDNNLQAPVCRITYYEDSIPRPGQAPVKTYIQYNDANVVLYSRGKYKYFIYRNPGNIVIKKLDTSLRKEVRTDSLILDNKGVIVEKFVADTLYNSILERTVFSYDPGGQLIRMDITPLASPGLTTICYEWQNGDVVKRILNGDTISYYYDTTRAATDSDPWILDQKLNYGTVVFPNKHLRTSTEYHYGGGAIERYDYRYVGTSIMGIDVFYAASGEPFRISRFTSYRYTCE